MYAFGRIISAPTIKTVVLRNAFVGAAISRPMKSREKIIIY